MDINSTIMVEQIIIGNMLIFKSALNSELSTKAKIKTNIHSKTNMPRIDTNVLFIFLKLSCFYIKVLVAITHNFFSGNIWC
jgi:hypothetical protein